MGKRARRTRSSRSFNREGRNLLPRRCILIVCEGQKTEPNYFKGLRRKLRLRTAEVRICGRECGSAPISVVQFAKGERKKRRKEARRSSVLVEYDEVWCVMDVEKEGTNSTLVEAIQLAKKEGLNVALSNPCFEFWILLHFEYTSRPYQDCREVVRHLKSCLKKKKIAYRGKADDIFDELSPYIEDAIARAKRLEAEKNTQGCNGIPNPSTTVYRLVEILMDLPSQ